MTKKQNELAGGALIVFIFLSYMVYLRYSNDTYKSEIVKDYKITTGFITGYSISGDFDNRVLIYEYHVFGKKYKRKITPNYYYDECQDDINLCSDRVFHVIYSSSSPGNSLIDLSQVIIKIDSAYVKNNLDKFE